MKLQLLLCLLLTILPGAILACSCGSHSSSFNLMTYDQAYDVVEVRFHGPAAENASSKDDSDAAWAKNYGFNLVSGEVISAFKGKMTPGKTVFRSPNSGGACGFRPELDQTYLIYLYQGEPFEGLPRLELTACQRKLMAERSLSSYFSEKCILEDLQEAAGTLSASQLAGPLDSLYEVAVLSGGFVNGKRHGNWQIYSPLLRLSKPKESGKLLSILKYQKGVLKGVEAVGPLSSSWLDRESKRLVRFYESFAHSDKQ